MPFRWKPPVHTQSYKHVAQEAYDAGYAEGVASTNVPTNAEAPKTIPPLARILLDVEDECGLQVKQWGEQSHPDGTGEPWSKENADKQRERTEYAAKNGELTWKIILLEEVLEAFAERAADGLREELVQVAAVCASWIRDLDAR